MKRKIIMLSILSLVLAFTAENVCAFGGGTAPNPGSPSIPPAPPAYHPTYHDGKEEAMKEVRWTLQSVLDSLNNKGLITKSDYVPTNELPSNIPGLISSAEISYGSFSGHVCEFDSSKNAFAESQNILKANEKGSPYTRSWRRDNIIIMLKKGFPPEQVDKIFDALKDMVAK